MSLLNLLEKKEEVMESNMPEKTYGLALEKAKQDLRGRDPMMTAALSGAKYEKLTANSGRFRLRFCEKEYVIDYPEALVHEEKSGQEASIPSPCGSFHLTKSVPKNTRGWLRC